MRMVDAQSLIYSPLCSWVYSYPRIYFNRDLLAEGEPFKIIAYTPDYSQQQSAAFDSDLLLNIYSLSKNGEAKDLVHEGISLKRLNQSHHALAISTGLEETLTLGPYVAQIVSTRYSEIIGVHRFYVATRDEYQQIWKYTFGEQWDKPIYWDQMERGQGEELLQGLRVDRLLEVLPNDFEWNARSIYQFLGHLITTFMSSGHGSLPFEVVCEPKQRLEEIPHVDLTKLIWLLNVIGPVLTDTFFLSARNRISVSTDSSGVYIDIYEERPAANYKWSEITIRKEETDIDNSQPALFDVIKETVGSDLDYKVYRESDRFVNIGMLSEGLYSR